PGSLGFRATTTGLLRQELTEHDGAVVVDIVSAVKQRHPAVFAGFEKGRPDLGLRVQLPLISPAKLFPTLHLVSEPSPQLGAGGDLLQPRIRMERLFFHTARPESFHQDALAVCPRRALIGALDADHDCLPLRTLPPAHHAPCLPVSSAILSRAMVEWA